MDFEVVAPVSSTILTDFQAVVATGVSVQGTPGNIAAPGETDNCNSHRTDDTFCTN